MIEKKIPAWMLKAREFAARVRSPVSAPFAAKKTKNSAKLYLYDAIGRDPWSDTGIDPTEVVQAIADAKGADDLEVYINSPGGYVFDGIAIFNAIRAFDGTRTVYVDGVAASIASVIAMAGDTVVMNEGSMFMIHDPMGGVFSFGTADEIEDDARKTVNALRKVRENLLDIYVSATGQPLKDISAWMTAETWMTAAEAKARGFADDVVSVKPDEDPDEEEEKPAPRKAAAAAPLSPRAVADIARAQVRSLSDRFAGASPSATPGQPGSPNTNTGRSAGRTTR